jgi:hypothetical protein
MGVDKELFFYLLDLTILSGYIILTSYGSKISSDLDQNLLEMSVREPQPQSTPREKPNQQADQMTCI